MDNSVSGGVLQGGIRWGRAQSITGLIDRYYLLKKISTSPLTYFTLTHSEALILANATSPYPFGEYCSMTASGPDTNSPHLFMGVRVRVRPIYAKGRKWMPGMHRG